MKYFRPELFIRGNSHDLDEAEVASLEWEAASRAYARRLKRIGTHLPANSLRFLDEVQLHDAVLIGLSLDTTDERFLSLGGSSARLFLKTRDAVVIIAYRLTAKPEIVHDTLPPRFVSKEQQLCLYDEFEFDAEKGCTTHEFFLSDGTLIKLSFHEFEYATVPLATLTTSRRAGGKSAAPIPN